jgi:hypothetical protein
MTDTLSVTVGTGTWSWSDNNAVPPSNKQFRTNTGDWANATIIYISNLDDDGLNHSDHFDALTPGAILHFEHNTDATRYADFNVVSVDETIVSWTYHAINVTYTGGGGTLPNNNTLIRVIGVGESNITPDPPLGHMYLDLLLTDQTPSYIIEDLMDLICDNLVKVTHLVNHVDIKANVGSGILTENEDIMPAVAGPPAPLPV